MRLILDLWNSFRALPLWVQIWVAAVLVPVNAASIAFVTQPAGIWVAVLANVAMVMNLPVLVRERGFSKMLAFPHLLPWTALVLWLALARPEATGIYGSYLTVLLIVDAVSLVFDYTDALAWLRGERKVAGRG